MSYKIREQRDLLTKIAQAIMDEIDCDYDMATYRGEIDDESVNSILSVMHDAEHKYVRLSGGFVFGELVLELHEAMKAHTGGNWNALVLTLDKNGQIRTKFEYRE